MLIGEGAPGCPPQHLAALEQIWQDALCQIHGALRSAEAEANALPESAPQRVHRGCLRIERVKDADPFNPTAPTIPLHLGDSHAPPLVSARLLIRDLDGDWWAVADLQWVPGQPADTGSADFWLWAGEGAPPDTAAFNQNDLRRPHDLRLLLHRRAGQAWRTDGPLRYDVQHPLLWALSENSSTR